MKNLVFISPNFPENYWHFCAELKKNGFNVLGIGDQVYDTLDTDLKNGLTEYFKVGSLKNKDEVYRAVAFFAYKYGPIDWLESNNEYWLENDAHLRTAFHITSGFQVEDLPRIKNKSKMKEYYKKAGIKVARYHLVHEWDDCMNFINEVGYPVIAKPDNGVGAIATHRISNEHDLSEFFKHKCPAIQYIMEEYIFGEIFSYDAIVNSKGEPIFEAGNVTPNSIMDIVNNQDNCVFYINKYLADDIREAGRATLKAFGVKSRFIHFEFFRLGQDQQLGKKGELIGLEVNMRPSGGISPDMMNFAHSTDVYKIWADMIAFDYSTKEKGQDYFCGFAGRRDGKNFVMSHDEVMQKYGNNMKMVGRVPEALSGAMGNQMYIATFDTQEQLDTFYQDVLGCR